MTHYSRITMTLPERAEYIKANRSRYSPERLLAVTTELSEDRARAAILDSEAIEPEGY